MLKGGNPSKMYIITSQNVKALNKQGKTAKKGDLDKDKTGHALTRNAKAKDPWKTERRLASVMSKYLGSLCPETNCKGKRAQLVMIRLRQTARAQVPCANVP